jgi:phage terminase large subunit GpA-like protein
MATLEEIARRALSALIPPVRLRLSDWIEANIHLPSGVSAIPGKVRLYPFQRAIADSLGDPAVERVTLVKPVRVGFSTLLTAALGHFAANDPAQCLVLLPTADDTRDYMVSDLDPLFEASPALKGVLSGEMGNADERSTLLHRRFPGGSLKVVAAKAPRNLRRHTARILFCDEVDGMEATAEGSAVLLAERRTLSFANRKIVIGSTPLDEETSEVLRSYAQSDQRVFECPCPSCGCFTEIMWQHIEWETDRPETAAFRCQHCEELTPERHKRAMVESGRWRATKPEVIGHHGYRLNALVSPLPNATWPKLAIEFLQAKDDPTRLKPFVNTALAQGWRDHEGDGLSEGDLASRVEPFSLDAIPIEVLTISAGVDLQDDRIEVVICGFDKVGTAYVLAHSIIWGSPNEDQPWRELNDILTTRWDHPLGGKIGIDACAIDSGYLPDTAYRFAFPRASRRVIAIKGLPGFSRPVITVSKSPVTTRTGQRGKLWLVGVDTVKAQIYSKLARGRSIRFSDSLDDPAYFEQIASERLIQRFHAGQPIKRFERISGRRAEALDCLCYSLAARAAFTIPLETRALALANPVPETAQTPTPVRQTTIRSAWMER